MPTLIHDFFVLRRGTAAARCGCPGRWQLAVGQAVRTQTRKISKPKTKRTYPNQHELFPLRTQSLFPQKIHFLSPLNLLLGLGTSTPPRSHRFTASCPTSEINYRLSLPRSLTI